MSSVTYVKFMKREELIKMLTEIHSFSIVTADGKTIRMDKRLKENRPTYENIHGIRICWHAVAFKLSAFDYEDVLKCGEGYVRYSTFEYSKKIENNPQGTILVTKYGFVRES